MVSARGRLALAGLFEQGFEALHGSPVSLSARSYVYLLLGETATKDMVADMVEVGVEGVENMVEGVVGNVV